MSSKEKSASDKFLELIHPEPVAIDSDEENETSARVVENDFTEELDLSLSTSALRKQNAQFLDDDERYQGKKISRKALISDEEESEDDLKIKQYKKDLERKLNKSEISDNVDDEDDVSFDEEVEEEENEEDYEEVEGEEDGSESDFENDKVYGNDDAESENDEMETVRHLSKGIQEDKAKEVAVRNQINIWDNLIECRIQLQKCLLLSNSLPKYDTFKEFRIQGGKDFNDSMNETTESLEKLLEKFLEFQNIKFNEFSETRNLESDKNKKVNDEEDDEIPSDTEEEEEKKNEEKVEETNVKQKRKRKSLDDLEKTISEGHKKFCSYRNNIIEKWNDKTRLLGHINNKDFSSFEQSTVKQVEQVLSNRQRLVDRTRLKRSNYKIIGRKNENSLDHDPEIFDDNDFYHQLLRELIERRAADVTDPVQLGRQWLELQKLRSKMKRKIDVKATKGRRVRFTVHSKLVNFMAPKDNNTWTDQAKTELYNSLFGKKS